MDPSTSSFASRLPGDALQPSSPSPSPSPPPPSAVASSSSQPQAPAYQQPGKNEARTIVLTSISPTDPSKKRDFEARYYLAPSSSASSSTTASLPDSYFQPTAQELQRAHAQSIAHVSSLVDRPLLTSKLRQQQQAEKTRTKLAKWPHTKIRIRFNDRSQLEGVLKSETDKLVHVYEFVRLALRPELRHIPFVLYQSPPRTEYRRTDLSLRGKSLLDLQFTPSTSLYLKFEPPSPTPSSSDSSAAAEVDIDALNASTTSPTTFLVQELVDAAGELPLPPSFDPTEQATIPSTATEGGGVSDEAQRKKDKEERLRRLLGGKKKK
ncbi:hypothetical protein JCM10908_006630 [Rhodotorula pacifica]|uniref:uncharacterized protein n=1 Tax=Rhodotorula pacifica TaxID=1495444 RepID=UPI00316E93E2